YMEGIVKPVSWADWPESAVGIFKGFRSDKGEDLILERNMFIEGVLPSSIIRKLSDTEMNAYRAPHLTADDRQPLLNWPRQIPIEGEPENVVALVNEYGAFMAGSDMPKLFVNADPGSILLGPQREFCRSWPNQQEVTVKGLHFIQEDSPVEIGQAVANWLTSI
ncbi:MAG: haloalkane dehalogenase, partial [Pseudomonadales bacterium]